MTCVVKRGNNMSNYLEELEKLSGLKGKGVITEEEFQKEKDKILNKTQAEEPKAPTGNSEKVDKLHIEPKRGKKIVLIALSIFALLVVIGIATGPNQPKKSSDTIESSETLKEKDEPELVKIAKAKPYNVSPAGELADMFKIGSDYTDLQRENKEKELTGKIVDWDLQVYEIKKVRDNIYRIQTTSPFLVNRTVSTFTYVNTRNDVEKEYLARLKTDDMIHIKGKVKGISMRTFEINPAIVLLPGQVSAAPEPSVSPREKPVPKEEAMPPSGTRADACVDAWVADYRKEKGQDEPIRVDILEEVRKECEAKNR
jgi:hypothetical protein